MTSYLQAHCIDDFRLLAQKALPKMVFDFIDGGAGSESTVRENRTAFEHIRLLGSAPVDVAVRSQEVTIFGKKMAMPVIIGPTGLAGAVWPRADVHLATAAARFGIPFVMSTAGTVTMDAVAKAASSNAWFQLYLFRDRAVSERLMANAWELGFNALEVTVDNAMPGRRLRDSRNGFSLPMRWTPSKVASILAHPSWAWRTAWSGAPTLAVMAAELGLEETDTIAELMQAQLDPSIGWDDIQWVRDRWKGPLIVKGLLDPAQGVKAMELGADGIVVSNHGGRQLDGAVATIDILPEFVDRIRGRMPILVDSGFRTGSDIAKALALGATAVQIGRPTLYAAASGGEPAIHRALEILKMELDICQSLMGASTISEITDSLIRIPSRPSEVRGTGRWRTKDGLPGMA